VVELSNGDIISGSRCFLTVEIDKPLLLTKENSHVACERDIMNSDLTLNVNRKSWSLYQLITSLPVRDVIELVK
jgi:hypothetical protein